MKLERLKAKAIELYEQLPRSYADDRCCVCIDKDPKLLRHEDHTMNNHGTWIDVSIYVPDDDPPKDG